MGDEKTITVADVSDGACSRGEPGTPVSLPVVELLTGRGFVTGKSGSGKSNSASVIAEKLLDNGFGLLIVDIDGEYYGLKEEYEILHAGGDEECDIQVTPDHAEKLATLALEQNVPIILDVSSFLDESEARELLTAIAKQLFVKAKKLKQPFLLLVEEIHEYIPENGGVDECGRMLIKIGKRGRKHGLGITGISQRPADVKKDFITQCDWLLWHRLTWNNDTKVVQRIIDAQHADAVEDLGDGEGFLMTDWAESVRRVQFHRKQTFDAGATPGLDDFERPELKSVSEDLVSELQTISEAEQQREDTIADLREELNKKNSRIAELEKELQDARDLSRMADQFVDALLDEVEGAAPGRTETERIRARRQRREGVRESREGPQRPEPSGRSEQSNGSDQRRQRPSYSDPHTASPESPNGTSPRPRNGRGHDGTDQRQPADAEPPFEEWETPTADSGAASDAGDGADAVSDAVDEVTDPETSTGSAADENGPAFDPDEVAAAFDAVEEEAGDAVGGEAGDAVEGESPSEEGDDVSNSEDSTGTPEFDLPDDVPDFDVPDDVGESGTSGEEGATPDGSERSESGDRPEEVGFQAGEDREVPTFESFEEPDDAPTVGDDDGTETESPIAFSESDVPEFGFKTPEENGSAVSNGGSDDESIAAAVQEIEDREVTTASRPEPPSVGDLRATIRGFDPKTRRMLAYYHKHGPVSPLDAHFVAGGTGDRTDAYAHNSRLRKADLIEHVGRGKYDTCLDDRLDDATGGKLDAQDRRTFLRRLESLLEVGQ